MSRPKFRLAAAAISALALCSLNVAPAAFADPGNPYAIGGVNQEASNPALVNPAGDVRLSIHKHLGAALSEAGPDGVVGTEDDVDLNNGTEQSVTLPKLQGVEFDVYQIYYDEALANPVNLTTNDGWTAASAIAMYTPSQAEIAAGSFTIGTTVYYLGSPTEVVTDSTGTATFHKVDGQGLYLVNESVEPNDVIKNLATNETVDPATITPASPFFVTLPMTHPTALNRWMYDVNVYPKNQSDTATKTVDDKGTVTAENGNVGEHGVDFTIKTSITAGMTGAQMQMYRVIDVLDARLTYVSTAVTIDKPGPAGQLVAADYSVSNVVGADGKTTVTVNLEPSGLGKLASAKAADPTAQVVTVITTTVKEEGLTGMIPNQAHFIPNQSSYEQNNGGIPTNETKTYYGDVIVNKKDPATAGVNMDGATFAIYWDPTPGDGECTTADVTGQTAINTLTIDNTAKTAADATYNQLIFKGLQASNWYNNAEQGPTMTPPTAVQSYCLVETKAPEGYNLDATAHYITIDYKTASADNPATPENESAVAFVAELVNNEKSNLGNNLPLTGGAGIAGLSLAGLALVGGGAAYYLISSRKRREQDA